MVYAVRRTSGLGACWLGAAELVRDLLASGLRDDLLRDVARNLGVRVELHL